MNNKIQTLTIISLTMLIFMLGGIAARYGPVSEIVDTLSSFIYLPFISNTVQTTQEVTTNVLYVFSSSSTTTGDAEGRNGMNAICAKEDPDAHFCTKQEIENAFVSTGIYFAKPFSMSWMDSIDLDYSDYWGNDKNCNGWSQDTTNGQIIYGEAVTNGQTSCTGILSVSCCKWVP